MKFATLVCLVLLVAQPSLGVKCSIQLGFKAHLRAPALRSDIQLLVNGELQTATLEAYTGLNNNHVYGSVTTVFMDPVVVLNFDKKTYRLRLLNEPETLLTLSEQFGNLGAISRVAIDSSPDHRVVRNIIYNNFFNPEPLITYEKRNGKSYLRALITAKDYQERFGINIRSTFQRLGADNTVSGVSFILKESP